MAYAAKPAIPYIVHGDVIGTRFHLEYRVVTHITPEFRAVYPVREACRRHEINTFSVLVFTRNGDIAQHLAATDSGDTQQQAEGGKCDKKGAHY